MTQIENVQHILKNGITHSTSPNANPAFVPIGDGSLINTRSNTILSNGRLLGEYIPFYFGPRMPMLYVIQNGYNSVNPTPAENIVYCVTSAQKIIDLELDFVFTDGHAVDKFSTQFTSADINQIDELLDMDAIRAKYWIIDTDLDRKRKKEAEFLILGDIPEQSILCYACYNESAKNRIVEFGVPQEKVLIKPGFYF